MADDLEFKAVTIVLLCLLAIITILINAVCICIISKSKPLLQRPSTYFILNLLTVHLIQGLVVFPFYAAKKSNIESLQWGQVICDGFRFSYMLTFYSAIYGVLLIGLDRVLATCWVWQYREVVTKKRVLISIIFVWIYIIVLCVIPFLHHDNKPKSKHGGNLNKTIDLFPYNNSLENSTFFLERNITKSVKVICTYRQSRLWTILMLVLNCMVLYLIIMLCYQIIIYKINKMDKRSRSMTTYSVPGSQNSDNHEPNVKNALSNTALLNNAVIVMNAEDIKKHKHIMHLAMILSVAYFLFWSPSVIYFILWSVCPSSCFTSGYKDSEAEMYIGFITKYLAFLDAFAAPLIYCFYHEEFRKLIPCKKFKKPELLTNSDEIRNGNSNC